MRPLLVLWFAVALGASAEAERVGPAELTLGRAQPNPVRASATISHGLSEAAAVRPAVYTLSGARSP